MKTEIFGMKGMQSFHCWGAVVLTIAGCASGPNPRADRSSEPVPAGEETLVFQVASEQQPEAEGYERATTLKGERIYLIPGEGIPLRHVRTARVRQEAHRETYAVDVQLDKRGRKLLAALTGDHTAKRLAIRVGGDVILAPWITERVTGGVVSVTGDFSRREAEQLARMLTSEKRENEGSDVTSNAG